MSNAETVVHTRVVTVEMLCRTIALFNRCDWADVCDEVSGLIDEIAAHIDGPESAGHRDHLIGQRCWCLDEYDERHRAAHSDGEVSA